MRPCVASGIVGQPPFATQYHGVGVLRATATTVRVAAAEDRPLIRNAANPWLAEPDAVVPHVRIFRGAGPSNRLGLLDPPMTFEEPSGETQLP
jgi:hypothetical protein